MDVTENVFPDYKFRIRILQSWQIAIIQINNFIVFHLSCGSRPTHFMKLVSFCTSWKHQQHKMDWNMNLCSSQILSLASPLKAPLHLLSIIQESWIKCNLNILTLRLTYNTIPKHSHSPFTMLRKTLSLSFLDVRTSPYWFWLTCHYNQVGFT